MNDLEWTKDPMTSPDYRQRFFAEYWQTRIRYERLRQFIAKIGAGKATNSKFVNHDCPLDLLKKQLKSMDEYLSILEMRAIIENVDLAVTNLTMREDYKETCHE